EAVLVILALCESGRMELISSDALVFEISHIPDRSRKEDALAVLGIAKKTLALTPAVEDTAKKFEKSGIKALDALHLAFACALQIDWFCTCDDSLLNKAKHLEGLKTRVVSPTELVMEVDR
ncbi:MAG: PIN domain-containing protein, partial [Thermodesulfobacteriota bacterium]